MANKRMISADTFEDEYIGSLDFFGRLLWIGMITTVADDQGRMIDNHALIRSKIFLYDQVQDADVEAVMIKLSKACKIVRYRSGNKSLIQIVNWWRYQAPSWASPSKYKPPEGWIDRTKFHGPGNEVISDNWDKDGGYIGNYIGNYPPPQDRPIEESKRRVRGDKSESDGEGEPPAAILPFRDIFDAFLDATGIPETMLANGQHVDEVDKWVKAGYTADEVRAAVSQMQTKGLTIARPSSITNALAIVRSKNHRSTARVPATDYTTGLPDYSERDQDEPQRLQPAPEFADLWRLFVADLPRAQQINLSDHIAPRYTANGTLVFVADSPEVAELAKSRWTSTLKRQFMADIIFEIRERENQ